MMNSHVNENSLLTQHNDNEATKRLIFFFDKKLIKFGSNEDQMSLNCSIFNYMQCSALICLAQCYSSMLELNPFLLINKILYFIVILCLRRQCSEAHHFSLEAKSLCQLKKNIYETN